MPKAPWYRDDFHCFATVVHTVQGFDLGPCSPVGPTICALSLFVGERYRALQVHIEYIRATKGSQDGGPCLGAHDVGLLTSLIYYRASMYQIWVPKAHSGSCVLCEFKAPASVAWAI